MVRLRFLFRIGKNWSPHQLFLSTLLERIHQYSHGLYHRDQWTCSQKLSLWKKASEDAFVFAPECVWEVYVIKRDAMRAGTSHDPYTSATHDLFPNAKIQQILLFATSTLKSFSSDFRNCLKHFTVRNGMPHQSTKSTVAQFQGLGDQDEAWEKSIAEPSQNAAQHRIRNCVSAPKKFLPTATHPPWGVQRCCKRWCVKVMT